MGHIRLGTIPKTQKWAQVIGLIHSGENVAVVASAIVHAAEDALLGLKNDFGFKIAAWLMVQTCIAGMQENPVEYLRSQGVDVREPTKIGLIAAIGDSLDKIVSRNGLLSTEGEIASKALTSALVTALQPKLAQQELFDTGKSEAVRSLEALGNPRAFDHVAREFFSGVTTQSITFYSTQETSAQIGEGLAFVTANQEQQFNDAMHQHIHEGSRIVENYGEGWFSKHHIHQSDGCVTHETVSGFAAHGITKMTKEIQHSGEVQNEG